MKNISLVLGALTLFSCNDNLTSGKKGPEANIFVHETPKTDTNINSTEIINDTIKRPAKKGLTSGDTIELSGQKPVDMKPEIPKRNKPEGIPEDGKYRYDMAFSEFRGDSRGEKVTVVIKGETIKIVYEGDGNLKVKKGQILKEGIIVKHKSGNWIIANDKKDAQLNVYGGCSGGPTIIDFINKKYWTC